MIPRSEHPISRKSIAPEALAVMRQLNDCGYDAYLVGGAVRDLFLGKAPKDYDIATDAKPSRLKKIFRNCRVIGRRFRIAHVYFPGGTIIEVATFRSGASEETEEGSRSGIVRGRSGVILRDNEYGTPEEDARRRDLTINGLFYDLKTFSVIDYVDGVADLERGIIRMITDPDTSFREDPVRMIRALRHAARTRFAVEERTLAAIQRNRADIGHANPSRLLEELLKDLRSGSACPFFEMLLETHLLDHLLPRLARELRDTGPEHPFWRRMRALDAHTEAGGMLTTAIYLALLLQTTLFSDPKLWGGRGPNPPDIWRHVSSNFRESTRVLRISRRDTERILQVVLSFRKLARDLERGRLHGAIARKVYISEALDFLEIDLKSQGLSTRPVEEWRAGVARIEPDSASDDGEDDGIPPEGEGEPGGPPGTEGTGPPRKRRRRRRRRRSRRPGEAT